MEIFDYILNLKSIVSGGFIALSGGLYRLFTRVQKLENLGPEKYKSLKEEQNSFKDTLKEIRRDHKELSSQIGSFANELVKLKTEHHSDLKSLINSQNDLKNTLIEMKSDIKETNKNLMAFILESQSK